MIDGLVETAVIKSARILFHKLFKAVFVQLFVFHMKIFVLFHISFVLESELTTRSIAMKMRRFLPPKRAIVSGAIFATTEPQKAFTLDGVVLSVIIEVHLYVGCWYVDFVTMTGNMNWNKDSLYLRHCTTFWHLVVLSHCPTVLGRPG